MPNARSAQQDKKMKKILTLFIITATLFSCKTEDKNNTLKGDFVYYADAAVLVTESEIFGVIINEKMHELDDKAQTYKNEVTDMVSVEIEGVVSPNPEGTEGWDNFVKITKIISVSKTDKNDTVKLDE